MPLGKKDKNPEQENSKTTSLVREVPQSPKPMVSEYASDTGLPSPSEPGNNKGRILTQTIITQLNTPIKPFLQRLVALVLKGLEYIQRIVLWLKDEFVNGSRKKKALMIGVPVLAYVILLSVLRIMPLVKPPVITTVFPADKSVEVERSIQIEIGFDRPVQAQSVENSFYLNPPLEGTFEWRSPQLMVFTPKQDLDRGTTYKMGFKTPIISTYYIPALTLPEITFSTQGLPRIVFKAPEIEAPETKTPITIVFSQPMTALHTATDSATTESILTIDPPLGGQGRWLGTSAYQFIPDSGYKKATTYTVSVAPDLRTEEGLSLDQNYSWKFSSLRPMVTSVWPDTSFYNSAYVNPTSSVSATLNMPVDPNLNINDYFVITQGNGQRVKGTITKKGNSLNFSPAVPWERGAGYAAVVKSGLTSAEGPNGLVEDYSWSFSGLPKLYVADTYPRQSENNAPNEANISIRFNTRLTKTSVTSENFTVDPPLEKINNKPGVSCNSSCDYVTISGKLKRLTTYHVTVHKDVTDIYNSSLLDDYTFAFTTGPHKTSVTLVPSGLQVVIMNQNMPNEVTLKTMNADSVSYTLSKMDEEEFLNAENASKHYDVWQYYVPAKAVQIKSWQSPVQNVEDQYVKQKTSLTDSQGNALPPGYYFFTATIPTGESTRLAIISSRSSLTLKRNDDHVLVWATDQSTSQVIPGMKINVKNESNTSIDQGVTNQDGIVVLKAPEKNEHNVIPEIYVFGSTDNDVTVTSTRWDSGISHWDFGLPYRSFHEVTSYPVYFVLDRTLYRPGHEVMYKGIVRKDTDAAFESVSPGEKVTVTARDALGKEFYSETKELNSFGSFSGKFSLGSDGTTGTYSLSAKYIDKQPYSQSFSVEEYKRPDFKVTIKPYKDDFVSGENLQFGVNGAYYYGAPVKNAALFYTVKSEDYYFSWDKNIQYEFGQPDSYWYRPWSSHDTARDDAVTEANTRLNAIGSADISIPILMANEKQSKRIMIDAAVTNTDNQIVGASEETFFHKSGIYVGVKPNTYVNKVGQDTKIDFVTLNPRGNELSGKSVTADVYRIAWVSVREEDAETDEFNYRNKPVDNLVTSLQTTSDEHGLASASFVPTEGGTYKVVAKSTDDRGNVSLSNTYFWVSGEGYESTRENHDRIPLVTDKYSYEVGDNASLFIGTPYGSDTAKTLVTFERASVLDYKIIDINDSNTSYSFQVTDKMSPNVYVGAVLVRGSNDIKKPPEFKIGYTELRVQNPEKKLSVEISTNQEQYGPRDTVQTSISVKDERGQPKKAELSLALVDRSLLDLAKINPIQPYEYFYQPRNLAVNTSQSLTFSLNRINVNVSSDSKGGDGDDQSKLSTKRKYFPETDYWNAHITTDDQGKASVSIPLADNLTTWKFTAVAASAKDAFGSGTKEIVATKDILLRPVMPRFLAVGDKAAIGAAVVNRSENNLNLTVAIHTDGLSVNDTYAKTVTVEKGDESSLLWNIQAADKTSATITLTARNEAGQVLDELELSLPITKYHNAETVALAGEVTNQKTEQIDLPKDLITDQGNLNVTLSSSLLGSNIPVMSYLVDYPYNCTEQTTSKFYPAITMYKLMNSNKVDTLGTYTKDDLKNLITLGIQKLQYEQKTDGGWGWWIDSRYSDPFISAYAYQALREAKDAGFSVEGSTLEQGYKYLLSQMGYGTQLSADVQAFILRVLAKSSKTSLSGYADNLFNNRIKLSVEGKAYLLEAMTFIGSNSTRKSRLRDEVVSLAKKTATGVHWEDKKNMTYSIMGSDLTTTAAVMDALLTVEPANPLLSDAARYIYAALKNSNRFSTRSASAIMHAMVAYTKAKGDFGAGFEYKTTLNNTQIGSGSLSKNEMGDSILLTKPISDFTLGTNNSLIFSKTGKGTLYYTANLKYYLPYAEIAPLERGITVIRDYEDMEGNRITKNKVKAGSLVRVRLTIVANETRHKTIIEDKLPAGLEAFNENLNGQVQNDDDQHKVKKGIYELYYTRKETRDDRVVYFTDLIQPGVYEVSYLAHATNTGTYHRPAASAYEMYMPDVMGHTDGGWFEVTE